MKTFVVVLGVVGMLVALDPVAAQQPVSADSPSLKPAKPFRVVNLKSGSFVIDAPGNWVLNRSWRFEDVPDVPLNIIEVVADDVVLDFRGFEIEVEGVPDTRAVTVINVQGDRFLLRNAEVSICCGAQSSALRSTGFATQIEALKGFGFDSIILGDFATSRNSSFHSRHGVGLGPSGAIENTFISCHSGCLGFAGDENKLLNSRIRPAEFSGIHIGGNGNVVAGNVLDYPATGPELEVGFDVLGNGNVLRGNVFSAAGQTFVAINVSGTRNVIDSNIAARPGRFRHAYRDGYPVRAGR